MNNGGATSFFEELHKKLKKLIKNKKKEIEDLMKNASKNAEGILEGLDAIKEKKIKAFKHLEHIVGDLGDLFRKHKDDSTVPKLETVKYAFSLLKKIRVDLEIIFDF
jgi:hypothetical protein